MLFFVRHKDQLAVLQFDGALGFCDRLIVAVGSAFFDGETVRSDIDDAVIIVVSVQDIDLVAEGIHHDHFVTDHAAAEHPAGDQVHTAVSGDVKQVESRLVVLQVGEPETGKSIPGVAEFRILTDDIFQHETVVPEILLTRGKEILRGSKGHTYEQEDYSYAENPALTLKEALGSLETSEEATRDLYLYMLLIIPALTQVAQRRIEAAKGKFNPTEEDLNPNMKFVRNGVSALLEGDPDFLRLTEKKKMSWAQQDAFLSDLYNRVRSRQYFLDYMASETSSIKEDAALWKCVFEEEFEDDPALAAILEDASIHWADDLAYALGTCLLLKHNQLADQLIVRIVIRAVESHMLQPGPSLHYGHSSHCNGPCRSRGLPGHPREGNNQRIR